MAYMFDYLTESELEIEKEFRKNEADGLRLINAMESVILKHDLDLSQIEANAVFESYSDDILSSEYEREYNVYTEGVKEVWEKFKQWVKGIIDSILGRKNSVPDEELLNSAAEVELECNPNKLKELLQHCLGAIKNILTLKKTNENGEKEFNTKKFMILGSTVVGVGGIATAIANFNKIKEKVKVKVKDLPRFRDVLTDLSKKIENILNNNVGDDGEKNSALIKIITPLLNLSNKIITSIKNFIDKHGKGKEEDLTDDKQPENEGSPEKGDEKEPSGDKQPGNEGSPEKKPSGGTKKVYSYGGAKVPAAIVSYSLSHGKVGLSDNNKNKSKKKMTLSSTEMAAVYNAAKQNGDLNEKDLEKWKAFINNNGDKAITVEFTDDGYITMGDPIFENMGLGDIDHILGDDYGIDEMFESTDMGLLDEINGIFDEFFS